MPSSAQRLREAITEGWPRDFPLYQPPNPPLIVGLAGAVGSRVLDGDASDYAQAVTVLGLGAWAWLELSDGANWFRRALGAGALAYLVVRLGGEL